MNGVSPKVWAGIAAKARVGVISSPVPWSEIVCVVLGEAFRLVSVNTRESLIVPPTVGAKLIGRVQVAPAASVPGVLLVLPVSGHVPLLVLSRVKSAEMLGLFPPVGIGKFSAAFPLLATVTVRTPSVESVEPTLVAVGKLRDGGSLRSISFTALLFWSATNKFPLPSTATPEG